MKALNHLYADFNRDFWNNQLPAFRVRRRRMPWLKGLCDRRRRTIWIRASLSLEDEIRHTLLHEMCHVKAGAKDDHGPYFLAELARLTERGDAWAEKEREMYADRQRCIAQSWHNVRIFMEDILFSTEDLSSLKWPRVKKIVAHSHGMSISEFARRFRGARKAWMRLCQEEAFAREKEKRFQEAMDGPTGEGVSANPRAE